MLHLDIYHVYIRLVLNFVLPLFHIQMTNGNQINGRANWTYDENVNNLFFFFYILLSLQIWWKGIVCCVLFVERDGPVKKKRNTENECAEWAEENRNTISSHQNFTNYIHFIFCIREYAYLHYNTMQDMHDMRVLCVQMLRALVNSSGLAYCQNDNNSNNNHQRM